MPWPVWLANWRIHIQVGSSTHFFHGFGNQGGIGNKNLDESCFGELAGWVLFWSGHLVRWKADETCASDSAFTSTTRFPLWAGQLAHATRAASGREFSTGGSNYGSFFFFFVFRRFPQRTAQRCIRLQRSHNCLVKWCHGTILSIDAVKTQGAKMGYIWRNTSNILKDYWLHEYALNYIFVCVNILKNSFLATGLAVIWMCLRVGTLCWHPSLTAQLRGPQLGSKVWVLDGWGGSADEEFCESVMMHIHWLPVLRWLNQLMNRLINQCFIGQLYILWNSWVCVT